MVDAPYLSTKTSGLDDRALASKQSDQQSGLIKVGLFGGFTIEAQTGTFDLQSRKAKAILAYLMLLPSHKATRENIAGLLWSGATEDHARSSLRQALRRLNQFFDTVDVVGIDVTRNEVRLNRRAFETDLWAVLESSANASIHPILLQRSDVSDSLLLGFEDLDEAFNSWVLTQRQNLQDRLISSLERLLAQHSRSSSKVDAQIAKNAALALANLDPTHEAACRQLMLHHAQSGDIGSALKRYNRLWSILENDFDMEPSDETKTLVALIKSGDATESQDNGKPDIDPRASNPSGTPRLIVESFSDDGIPGPLKFITRAFRHQFMSSLLKFREWLVIDGERSERQRLMLPTNPIFRISGDTFVKDTVLYVALSVTDTASDTLLWSEQSPASLETWPRPLHQLVQKLAIAINVHLATGRKPFKPDEAREATPVYDKWMRGRRLMHRGTPISWFEAREVFMAVCREEPEFAQGHSSLSFCASLKSFVCPSLSNDQDITHLALEHAKRSIDLGPRDAKSYQASGWAHLRIAEFERAALCFGIAETLNENDIGVAVYSALGLAYCGETEESLRRLNLLQQSSFVYLPIYWSLEAACRFICRDYSGTIWAGAKANEDAFYPQIWSGLAFAQLGNDTAADRETQKFLAAARENWIGKTPPLPRDIADWFLSVQPFQRQEDYLHMTRSMERIGLTTR